MTDAVSDASSILEKIYALPPVPRIASRVLQLAADPDSSIRALSTVISADQALTACILKIANSSLLGLPRQISTLERAVVVLGTEEVKNIVLSQVMFNSFKRLKKSEGFSVSRYWQHCFVCGLGTKMLASKTGKTSSDYFVAGLIHDIGKLVEYLAVPEMFRKINEKKNMPPFMFVEEEQRIIGTTHCYLGQCLLKRWMFPDTIVAASGFHHSPEKAGDHQFLSEVVCAADLMAWFVEAEAEPVREAAAQQFRERSFPVCTGQHGLDLSENSIDAITAELAVVKEQEQELFKLLL